MMRWGWGVMEESPEALGAADLEYSVANNKEACPQTKWDARTNTGGAFSHVCCGISRHTTHTHLTLGAHFWGWNSMV